MGNKTEHAGPVPGPVKRRWSLGRDPSPLRPLGVTQRLVQQERKSNMRTDHLIFPTADVYGARCPLTTKLAMQRDNREAHSAVS